MRWRLFVEMTIVSVFAPFQTLEYQPWGIHAAQEVEQRHQQPHVQYGLSGACAGLLNNHMYVCITIALTL